MCVMCVYCMYLYLSGHANVPNTSTCIHLKDQTLHLWMILGKVFKPSTSFSNLRWVGVANSVHKVTMRGVTCCVLAEIEWSRYVPACQLAYVQCPRCIVKDLACWSKDLLLSAKHWENEPAAFSQSRPQILKSRFYFWRTQCTCCCCSLVLWLCEPPWVSQFWL